MSTNIDIVQIISQYYEPVRMYILSRVHNQQVAEDIVQEVFIKVFLNLRTLDTMQNIKAWVYRVAKNRTIDYHRSQQYRNDTSPDLLLYVDAIETDDIAGMIANRIDVQQSLAQLPELWRDILLLHFLYGHTYNEIDRILRKKFTKEYSQRAMKKFRKVHV